MKICFSRAILAVACLIAATPVVMAETSTLSVKGEIAPQACLPSLSNNGIVDLGNINVNSITGSKIDRMREKINFTIDCPSPATLAFEFIDNRPDSIAGEDYYKYHYFGLGKTSGGIKIGYYDIYIGTTPVVDGKNHDLLVRLSGETSWSIARSRDGNIPHFLTYKNYFSLGKPGEGVPTAITKADIIWEVNSHILKDVKDIKQIEDIDGNATVSLIYL